MKGPPCITDGVPCDKRHPACRDHCEEFQTWKAERNKEFLFNYQQNRIPLISENSERQYWRNLRLKNRQRATNRRK